MIEFFRGCTDPFVAKVLLVEAPAVMGQSEWMEETNARWVDTVQAMLEACEKSGAELPGDVDILANMLIATIDRAGMLVAQQPDELERIEVTVISLLNRIVGPAQSAN